MFWSVCLSLFFVRRPVQPTEETNLNINFINQTLNYAIRKAAEKAGAGQPSRNRKLSWAGVICLLIGAEGGSLAKALHRADIDVTPDAISQRRAQISPETFRDVFQRFNVSCEDSGNFRGYRLLAVDGTSVNIPRNPRAPSFVQNESAPNGYNQLHLNPLYDLCNKIFYDALIQPEPQKDEIGALIEMIKRNHFSEKTIIIADRGYESYNVMAHLLEKPNTDFLIRIKQNHSAMQEVVRLPMFELDCEIGFTITTTQTKEDKEKRYIFLQVPKKSKPGAKTRRGRWDFPSPYQMKLRIVRFQLETGEFETIATSLPRTFTLEDIRELYHLRWGIETSFRDLKITLLGEKVYGKDSSGIACDVIDYKRYDSEGYSIDSGSVFLDSLREGEKFKDSSIVIYDITPGETYGLQLMEGLW